VRAEELFCGARTCRSCNGRMTGVKLPWSACRPWPPFYTRFLSDLRSVAAFGGVLLANMEQALATAGYVELRRNVWGTNVTGRTLCKRAEYETCRTAPQSGSVARACNQRTKLGCQSAFGPVSMSA
jgi:hypothetical protein